MCGVFLEGEQFRFKKYLSMLVHRKQDTRRKKNLKLTGSIIFPFTWFPDRWEGEIKGKEERIGR